MSSNRRLSARRASETLEAGVAPQQTASEIEAAICAAMARFEQDFMGRGTKDIQAHLVADLLVIRLRGVLTSAEQHLVRSLAGGKGRDLLKQIRTQLIEAARPALAAMVESVTGLKVISLHHDLSTVTGEAVVVLSLNGVPAGIPLKKR